MSDYDIGKAFESIEDEIMASMMRNLSRHRAEETAMGLNWSQWQVEQLKALKDFKSRNAKKYPGQFRDINDRIPEIIRAQRKAGQADQEVEILEAMKQGHKPPAKKMKTTKQAKLDAQFFTTNDRKMNALIKATTDDMKKAETSILRRANDQYRKIIYNAQVYANSGAGTYAKAVDMATKDFLSAGINSIEYKNGSRHTVSDYADMAIRTASKRAYLTGEGEKRKEMGEHLVIMNKRGAPCPKCLPFVGKIMIDDVWSGGSKEDGNYPLMSTAINAGLYHPRCQDSHSTYFVGITKADGTYTRKEIKDIEEENKQEAKEQYAIRQEKKYERLAKYSLDEENIARYETKREEWLEFSTKGRIDNTIMARKVIESNTYSRKINKLPEDDAVRKNIKLEMIKMIKHRSGTLFEDLIFINSKTGELKRSDQFEKIRAAKPTRKMLQMLNQTEDDVIIGIHNHPGSTVPSFSDIAVANIRKYKYGLIAAHDGNIFKYWIIGQIDKFIYDLAVANLNREGYTKDSLQKFCREVHDAGVGMEVL